MLFRISLPWWILIAGAAGVALGFLAPEFSRESIIASNIFLRLIKSIIAPVMFGVLVRAIGGAGDLRELGRLGWKSVVFFEVATTLALLLGWFTVAIVQPGKGIDLSAAAKPEVQQAGLSKAIEAAIPTSIVDAMARGDVLQIVVFCFLFGAAVNATGETGRPIVRFADALAEVSFRYTRYVMYLAPAAVCTAMAATVAGSGSGALEGLARFVASAYAVQLFFLFTVLGGSLVIAGVPLKRFIAYAREPFFVAFATTSSAAALPATLDNMERFGVPKRILGIVTPLSLTLNPGGSTIHLAMCTLFVAQAARIHLSFQQQLLILLTLKVTSKGVAGIPRANFVILAGLFTTFGLPAEGLTMLLGIDAIIDMIRTSVNVTGHCVSGPVLARWEGEPLTASSQ